MPDKTESGIILIAECADSFVRMGTEYDYAFILKGFNILTQPFTTVLADLGRRRFIAWFSISIGVFFAREALNGVCNVEVSPDLPRESKSGSEP